MLVCLKDMVIHITYLDPFTGVHMTFGEVNELVHISCNPIVLLCVCVLNVMLSKRVLAIILPRLQCL